MKIALDFDGVISANYSFYFQLASDFLKSYYMVYIITAAEHKRAGKIIERLQKIGFPCTNVITRPIDFVSTPKNIGEWKKSVLKEHSIDVWWDNEVKIYEQAGVDFSDVKTSIIRV